MKRKALGSPPFRLVGLGGSAHAEVSTVPPVPRAVDLVLCGKAGLTKPPNKGRVYPQTDADLPTGNNVTHRVAKKVVNRYTGELLPHSMEWSTSRYLEKQRIVCFSSNLVGVGFPLGLSLRHQHTLLFRRSRDHTQNTGTLRPLEPRCA